MFSICNIIRYLYIYSLFVCFVCLFTLLFFFIGNSFYKEIEPGEVVLDISSIGGNLKVYKDRLTVLNPSILWSSIRANVPVKKGKWYYEVELVTGGLFQIGWVTSRCRFRPLDGYGFGVGDDEQSWAVDFQRGLSHIHICSV